MRSVADDPQVSVLMPSLNQCEFIEVAVRSVLTQSDVAEVIVSDGGSLDGTLAVLERLLGEFGPRLRWVSAADSGPAEAVNRALGVARGTIIGWLNADDVYAPGAIAVALTRFTAEAQLVMLYGEADHVDVAGRFVARYPTRSPPAGIEAFHAGCFVCQPTVFLRRHVFDEIGGLNEKLSTAFDFDLWLRVFLRYPGRIGYTESVQAFSRLHGRTITALQRKAVASEGSQLLAKYLGHAHPHWMLTYIDELIRAYPAYDASLDLRGHVSAMLTELAPCLEEQALEHLHSQVDQDKRLTAVPAGVHADMFPDGWAGPRLSVRIRSPLRGSFCLLLQCENRRPSATPLNITVRTSGGVETLLAAERLEQFEIGIFFPAVGSAQLLFLCLQSDSTFVPQLVEQGSTDSRELAFRVLRILLVGSDGSEARAPRCTSTAATSFIRRVDAFAA
jgi:glycosyltransferase involved in cell wall biosynthesis